MIINDPQENCATGFIKVYRSIQKHWIFSNPEYLRAWMIILMEVNYKDKKVLIHSDLLDCKRGESLNSLATWAELFSSKKGKRWTVQNVRTFLKLLKNDSMISLKGERKTTRLTVCNYGSYQSLLTDNQQTTNRQLTDNQQTTNNKQERKEAKKVKKEKINISFDQFWNLYGHKKGRLKAEQKWSKLTDKERELAMKAIPAYIKSTPDRQYRKHPATYLNGKHWEDEVTEKYNPDRPSRKILDIDVLIGAKKESDVI